MTMVHNRRGFLTGLLGLAACPSAALANAFPGERELTTGLTASYVREENLPVGAAIDGFTDFRTGQAYKDTQDHFRLVYCGAAHDIFAGEAGRNGCGDDAFNLIVAAGNLQTFNAREVHPIFLFPEPLAGQDTSLVDKMSADDDTFSQLEILYAPQERITNFALKHLGSSYGFKANGDVSFHMRNANLQNSKGDNLAMYRGSFEAASNDMAQKINNFCDRGWRKAPGCTP